jgi:cell division protein FtsL
LKKNQNETFNCNILYDNACSNSSDFLHGNKYKLMSEEEKKEIIDKELRGVTARNLIWFIGGIVTVLVTVMTTYFSIIRKLDGLNVIQNNVNVIGTKVENNSEDIKNLQQHIIPSLDNRMSIMEEKMKDKVFIKSIN